MAWRGSTTPLDRTFACLVYLLPLIDALAFAAPLLTQFPVLQVFFIPLQPLLEINRIPFAGLIIFFALYLLVVRNESINRFIRFNTMQAILLSIIVSLCSLVINYLIGPILGTGLLMETLYNVIFLGILAAVVYSVAQSVMGRYAEIPTLSDAVHMQVR